MNDKNKDISEKAKSMVESGAVYRFEGLDDEEPFEPFEGIPIGIGSELFVRVTKGNGVLNKDDIVGVDCYEFCFMSITKVD